jgi:predicted MPP superfamily phosphohydrolase
MSIFTVILTFFGASQVYWAWRGLSLARRRIRAPGRRLAVIGLVLAVYLVLLAFNFGSFGRRHTPVHLTLSQALLAAPFSWWAASSLFGALVALLFAIPQSMVGLARWMAARWRARPGGEAIKSPARRVFLERTAHVAVAAPFVAGAYGLLYGRLNLETPVQPIPLAHLPKAFEGFRICQLSDIHIGPFMTEGQIRKFADIANALKPDLTVLTGDFVTFDPTTQEAVVAALAGLRAPFGVFGCLGNHDGWCRVEDSITALFRQAGVRILRGEAVPIAAHGEWINLIGVDFQSHRGFGPSPPVAHLLRNIEELIALDRVNILLSHNPDTFDRAAELGIDLSMAGHTHGGQAALEFISPEIAPSRLVTPYVAGWFRKPGGQLYVNRGIGTIGVPIRLGAPPEITVYRLTRG